ncbi:MAG TPA: Ig-like domain-containing protein [Usitatibacter sp.]|nr:Ig-like domain-containing protein [Usitatibacter sp.]
MQRHAIRRAPGLLAASFLFVGAAVAWQSAHAQDATGVRAVPTYESVGLYWSNPGSGASSGCDVKFRKQGDASWRQGLAMWYDPNALECKGSLVYLTPGTTYEAQMSAGGASKSVTFTTWPNQYPVARTVKVGSQSATYDVSSGGSASGYVVYDGSGATIDGGKYNITVNASYVVVRGFTLKGAQESGILISKDVHDVIIEDNDISGWGRTRDGTWGSDMDSGVRAICKNEELERTTVQRNKIHDPRYSANSWTDGHPDGPQGITYSYCGGNHVFRWNEIYSTTGNHFNDGMGGEDNFSTGGFPNRDSDIYGNRISHTWDDGIESEGANMNVRIWGNFLDYTATGIASTVDSVGPMYIFRNVWAHNRFFDKRAADSDDRQPMFKSGSSSDFNNGRRYLFHNTMLQPMDDGSQQYGGGGGAGVGGTGDSQLVHNTVSMNNIYHIWKPNSAVYQVGSDNTFQNDMFNGRFDTAIVGGINATPTYADGNGWKAGPSGLYALKAGTPGFDGGVRIPNFNDDFQGAAPDVGAAEAGAAAMKFGLEAASAAPAGGAGVPATSTGTGTGTHTGTGSSTTGTAGNLINRPNTGASMTNAGSGRLPGAPVLGTSAPAVATTGSASISSTIDSSSYTAAAGSRVTFTVRVMGNGANPAGTVKFTANGNAIAGCGAVAVSNGQALCSTSALGGGTYAVRGVYSGDSTYGSGVAGPITQVITGGSVAAGLTIDSSSYTTSVGQSVTFTVVVAGPVAATGTVEFRDGGSAIANCSSVGVSDGAATCTTSDLSSGTHAISGYYSGDSNNSAGIAGPITQTVN